MLGIARKSKTLNKIVKALQLMRDEKYKFPGTIELEYEVPEGSNAVEEVKKCLAYCNEAFK